MNPRSLLESRVAGSIVLLSVLSTLAAAQSASTLPRDLRRWTLSAARTQR